MSRDGGEGLPFVSVMRHPSRQAFLTLAGDPDSARTIGWRRDAGARSGRMHRTPRRRGTRPAWHVVGGRRRSRRPDPPPHCQTVASRRAHRTGERPRRRARAPAPGSDPAPPSTRPFGVRNRRFRPVRDHGWLVSALVGN